MATETKTRTVSDRARAINEKRKSLANKRGPGTPISDEDLLDYIRKVRSENPEAKRREEGEYAYWIKGFKVGTTRFAKAWDAVSGESGEAPAKAKNAAKKSPGAKARETKKAAAKMVTPIQKKATAAKESAKKS